MVQPIRYVNGPRPFAQEVGLANSNTQRIINKVPKTKIPGAGANNIVKFMGGTPKWFKSPFFGGITGGIANWIVNEIILTPPAAKSDLASVRKHLREAGLEDVVDAGDPGEREFEGGQVSTATYRFKVRWDYYQGDSFFQERLSSEHQLTGPILGVVTVFPDSGRGYIAVNYQDQNGGTAEYRIFTAAYRGHNMRNGKFEYLIRMDGTSQQGDIDEGGSSPAIGYRPPTLTGTVTLGGGANPFQAPAATPISIGAPIAPSPTPIAPTPAAPPPISTPKPPGEEPKAPPPDIIPPPVVKPFYIPVGVPVPTPPPTPRGNNPPFYQPTGTGSPVGVPNPVSSGTTTTNSPSETTKGGTSLNPAPAPTTKPSPNPEPNLDFTEEKPKTPIESLLKPPVIAPPAAVNQTPKAPPQNQPSPEPPVKQTPFGTGGCGCSGQINASTQSIQQSLNNAGQAADLGLLAVINTKLGDQVPGGLSGWLGRFSRSLRLDRVMNVLNTMLLLHNAAMLSRSLAETVSYFINSGLQAIGIKDEDDTPININEMIGGSIESFFVTIMGQKLYTGAIDSWKKASAIYQSTMRIYDGLTNMLFGLTEGMEVLGEYTGKMGNALKRSATVLQDSYDWFDEKINFRVRRLGVMGRFINGLSTAEDITSNLTEVTENTIEIQESWGETQKEVENLRQLATERVNQKATEEEESEFDSLSPDIDLNDLAKPQEENT
ncbi:MAG: hypothetical protein AAGF26_02705 [Cyanobacteria bacterium P01_G01_bin.49]